MRKLIIATRGSKLALAQTEIVRRLLQEVQVETAIHTITTAGDRDRIHALVKIGGRGVFVREIERELLSGEADLAVHSAKDLPYELAPGLVIAGTPKAADPRDALVTRKGKTGGGPLVIGTGSPRRIAELRPLYPEAVFKDIRGNVTTRLHKLDRGEYDAIVLAMAGLERMGVDASAYDLHPFDVEQVMPAGCQGIIAVECRSRDRELMALLQKISHGITWRRFLLERELFCSMKVDCAMAVGIHASFPRKGEVRLGAMLDGVKAFRQGRTENYALLAASLKKELYDGKS